MQPDEVLTAVGELQARNLRVWIDGGWGVDCFGLERSLDFTTMSISLSN